MKKLLGIMTALLPISGLAPAETGNGLIGKKSHHSVKKTWIGWHKRCANKGFTTVLRWRHDASAENAGLSLRPTELLLFSKPKVGTHLMTGQQIAGIDLPMKMLVWKDAAGQAWLSYNDPVYIARRHGITDRDKNIATMSKAPDNFSRLAAE
ncbi:MAG TPA: DUF302 domain-containing protein [Gammaproteobacteria bacterium]|nr:DUF302 domain-containing protein [Gammaproteobacteria bacterium]